MIRRALAALAVVLLVCVVAVPLPPPPFTPAGAIVVVPDADVDRRLQHYGYDIKFRRAAEELTEDRARAVFQDDGFRVLRIPVYAKTGFRWHGEDAPTPVEMLADNEWNSLIIDRARMVSEVTGGNVMFFASLKLQGTQGTFPDWLVTDGRLRVERYTMLLAEYVETMASLGIPISYLGLDNERQIHRTRFGPHAFSRVAAGLERQLGDRMPKLVAAEGFHPDVTFLRDLPDGGWARTAVAGTHFYNGLRGEQREALAEFTVAARSRGREVWETEMHWDARTRVGGTNRAPVYDSSVEAQSRLGYQAMFSLFDHTDAGVDHISWWDYQRDGWRGEIMSAFSRSTGGAVPLITDDPDGRRFGRGMLSSRAYRQGDDLVVWAVNLTGTALDRQLIVMDGMSVGAPVTATQWTNSPTCTSPCSRGIGTERHGVRVTLPDDTITMVRVEGAF